MSFIKPIWSAPDGVHSFVTTRQGGISNPPYESLNLGLHVGDQLPRVIANRQILKKHLPTDPIWLNQTHSVEVSTPNSRSQVLKGPFDAVSYTHLTLPTKRIV